MSRVCAAMQRQVLEWGLEAERDHANPFVDIELGVVISHKDGQSWRVPAFWDGARKWRVRFAPPLTGAYTWKSEYSLRDERGLHGQSGAFSAKPYSGTNPLVQHGSVLDFDMLQTGHSGYDSISPTMNMVSAKIARQPAMPVVNGEVNYEGFLHGNYDEVQRVTFWGGMLLGAAGHTYGANGIWQVNTKAQSYGPSPHGATWGNRAWDEAMHLPGSAQLGIAKRLLMRFDWWKFQSHPEWIDPTSSKDNWWLSYAAGLPRQVRVIYVYQLCVPWAPIPCVKQIEPDVRYRACYVNPSTGEEHDLGLVVPDATGSWTLPPQAELRDWILVMQSNL